MPSLSHRAAAAPAVEERFRVTPVVITLPSFRERADAVRLWPLRVVLHRAGIRPAGAGETIGQIVELGLQNADRERLNGVL
jgi:hypothetical protein